VTLDDLRRNRNLLFWALHTLGWSAYLITQYLGALLYEKPTSYIKVVLAAAGGGFLLSAPLRYLYRRLWGQRFAVVVPAVLLASWIVALGWRVIINSSYVHWVDAGSMAGEPWYGIFVGTLSSTYLLLCWSGLYFGIKYYEALQEQRESMLRASALAQEAQVKMLRYQLNPHFLFNTLNLYLGIEQLRFGDRLKLDYDIDEGVTQALVPSLVLQPLVENSLKYAVAPREEGGRLRIEAREEQGRLRLVVQDDGPGLPVGVELGAGRGVGFRNTRERLAVLYGDRQKLAVRFSRPGLRLEITMPFERATQPT
jgi:two-component sensor histidine kinase